MYCPKCGNEQGSDQYFCRNCGRRLHCDELAESVDGGNVPASQTFGNAPLAPRQKGLRMAALFFGLGLLLIPLTFLFRFIFVDKAIYLLVPAIALCLTGLVRAGYALFLEEGEDVFRKGLRSGSTALNPSRPPAQVGMNHLISQDRHTDELAPPPSATENTTQLLNKARPDSQ